jgi:hypothetical protein
MVLEYLDRDVSFNEIGKMAKEKHKNNYLLPHTPPVNDGATSSRP